MFTFKFKHLILLALLIRLVLIPFASDDFNLWANVTFTNFLFDGYNPWTITYNDPCLHWINPWRCPPLQLIMLLPAVAIENIHKNYLVTLYAVKLPLIFVDIQSLFFLYKILRLYQKSDEKAIRYSLLFALNPVVILASSIGAPSTDPLPVLFTLISLYYFLRSNGKDVAKMAISAIFLGLAAASKLYSLFLVPTFLAKLKNNRRILFFSFFTLTFLLFNLPFLLWDFNAYLGMLLLHNVSGYSPAVIFLNPSLNLFLKILLALLSMILLALSYIRRAHIIANIVLNLLAVYSLMGFGLFDVRYFAWLIPFAILLISCERVEIKWRRFLPFIFLPPLVIFSIYNGPYNNVEGRTGFFYFFYHWLRRKIVVFEVLPYSGAIRLIMGALNISLILYYFLVIFAKAGQFNFSIVGHEKLNILQNLRKNRKLLLFSLVFALTSFFVFVNVVPHENLHTRVYVKNSTFYFYDDFSYSTLNYQWGCIGNGTYTIQNAEVPSFIVIDGNLTLYRGWAHVRRGFQSSLDAIITVRFRFESFPENVTSFSLLNTNGGWFGAAKLDGSEQFIYFDEIENVTYPIAEVDENWHIINITYLENKQVIQYDDGTSITLNRDLSFDYLLLGCRVGSKTCGGRFSIDYVKVLVRDFNAGKHDKFYACLSLLAPIFSTFLTLIIVQRTYGNIADKH